MSAARITQEEVERYLQQRRRHGFQLQGQDSTLRSFVRFAQDQGATHLTLDLARNWAQHTASARPLTWARRIEVLRGFARYLVKIDPETVVPPRSLFGPAHRRLVPHIFTETELTQLLQAAGTLLPKHGLRAATCRTLFGLLAATGLRIGEALPLGEMTSTSPRRYCISARQKAIDHAGCPCTTPLPSSCAITLNSEIRSFSLPSPAPFFFVPMGMPLDRPPCCTPCKPYVVSSGGDQGDSIRTIGCMICATPASSIISSAFMKKADRLTKPSPGCRSMSAMPKSRIRTGMSPVSRS